MNGKETYGLTDFKEADSILERHKREVIEKLLEYQIILLNKFKDFGMKKEEILLKPIRSLVSRQI